MNTISSLSTLFTSAILTILIAFSSLFAFAQTELPASINDVLIPVQADSVYKYTWDINNSEWQLMRKDVTITSNGLVQEITEVSYLQEQNLWLNILKTVYSYDSELRINEVSEFTWSDEFKRWDKLSKSGYTYDSSSFLTGMLVEKWNLAKQDWVNYVLYQYSYEDRTDWTNMFVYNWNTDINEWTNYFRYVHTFTGNNVTELVIYDWDKSSENWEKYKRTVYGYIADTLLDYKETYNWSKSNNAWSCFRRYNYSYNNDNNLIMEDVHLCLTDTMAYSEIYYELDGYKRRTQMTDKRWDKTNLIWNNYIKEVYYYGSPTDVEWEDEAMVITPNPASDYIEINIRNVIPAEAGIHIFDILGVLQLPRPDGHPFELEGEVIRIDISALAPGVYFVRVGDVVSKFIKI